MVAPKRLGGRVLLAISLACLFSSCVSAPTMRVELRSTSGADEMIDDVLEPTAREPLIHVGGRYMLDFFATNHKPKAEVEVRLHAAEASQDVVKLEKSAFSLVCGTEKSETCQRNVPTAVECLKEGATELVVRTASASAGFNEKRLSNVVINCLLPGTLGTAAPAPTDPDNVAFVLSDPTPAVYVGAQYLAELVPVHLEATPIGADDTITVKPSVGVDDAKVLSVMRLDKPKFTSTLYPSDDFHGFLLRVRCKKPGVAVVKATVFSDNEAFDSKEVQPFAVTCRTKPGSGDDDDGDGGDSDDGDGEGAVEAEPSSSDASGQFEPSATEDGSNHSAVPSEADDESESESEGEAAGEDEDGSHAGAEESSEAEGSTDATAEDSGNAGGDAAAATSVDEGSNHSAVPVEADSEGEDESESEGEAEAAATTATAGAGAGDSSDGDGEGEGESESGGEDKDEGDSEAGTEVETSLETEASDSADGEGADDSQDDGVGSEAESQTQAGKAGESDTDADSESEAEAEGEAAEEVDTADELGAGADKGAGNGDGDQSDKTAFNAAFDEVSDDDDDDDGVGAVSKTRVFFAIGLLVVGAAGYAFYRYKLNRSTGGGASTSSGGGGGSGGSSSSSSSSGGSSWSWRDAGRGDYQRLQQQESGPLSNMRDFY